MADLIDRQALIEEVRDDIRRGCFDQQTVINNIEYAPTVEPKRGEWISVKDRLPKPYERVLTYRKDYAIDTETYKGKFGKSIMWSWDVEGMTPVTHWMPHPEPPKEVE